MLCIVGVSGCGKVLTALAVMNLLPARAKRAMYPARTVEEAETESYFRAPLLLIAPPCWDLCSRLSPD